MRITVKLSAGIWSLLSVFAVLVYIGSFNCGTTDTGEPATIDSIKVVCPNGGEQFTVGDSLKVTWSIDTLLVRSLQVFLSIDSGKSYFGITDSAIRDLKPRGEYTWKIPATLPDGDLQVPVPSTGCMIKIQEYNASYLRDMSDAVFSIKPQS